MLTIYAQPTPKETLAMPEHRTATREEWSAARAGLLKRETDLTWVRRHDEYRLAEGGMP